jgi:hypothetical protein
LNEIVVVARGASTSTGEAAGAASAVAAKTGMASLVNCMLVGDGVSVVVCVDVVE